MRLKLLRWVAPILLCVVFLVPMSAGAAPAICGSNPSDCLVVFDAAGGVISFAAATEPDDPNTMISVLGIPADRGQFGNAITLIEPGGDVLNGPASDIFGVFADRSGSFVLGFTSDVENAEPGGVHPPLAPETTAGPYDATIFLSPALQAAGDTAQFFSDVEAPEPASIALLGTALFGFALSRRRRRWI